MTTTMKKIVFTNQKGGVGKSAMATQFAYYLGLFLKKRVLVIDFDHQRNTTNALVKGDLVTVSKTTAFEVLTSPLRLQESIEGSGIVLFRGTQNLLDLEREGEKTHKRYVENLYRNLDSLKDQFDYCVIDTNPNPDVRMWGSLVVSDFAISPIQLNQEAIDGIKDLLQHPTVGIQVIQEKVAGCKLQFLGMVINMVEPTPFQQENLVQLVKVLGKKLMFFLPNGKPAAIKRTTAIPEAQQQGLPLWKMPKTTSKETWRGIKPIFEQIVKKMG